MHSVGQRHDDNRCFQRSLNVKQKQQYDPRTKPQHYRSLRGPALRMAYLAIRRVIFCEKPRQVSRELAEYDRTHPDERLSFR